jgi:hypothetical protein
MQCQIIACENPIIGLTKLLRDDTFVKGLASGF